jgi:hypothetical protein
MRSDLGICRPRVQRLVYQLFLLACVRSAAEAAGDSLCGPDRRAACILGNATTHMLADCEVVQGHGLKLINLSNLQLIFLPSNVTSRAEPLDQGIIACVKAHYRRRLIKWLLDAANAPGNEQRSLKELVWRIEHIEHIVIALLYNKLAGVCLFSFVNAPWTGIMFFRQVE